MTALTIVSDERYLQHDTGGGDHPETPARVQAISQALEESVCSSMFSYAVPRVAEREWLLHAHTEAWLFRFEEAVLAGRTFIDHSDNQIGYESYDTALLAAGAGLTAIDLLENQKSSNVFCLVRPPGHHAERNIPFGFCFFNNCVVAAKYWQHKYHRKRVLIFDFDAHHGNGIQSALEEEREGFYLSIHEHPSFSYPGTGYADEHGIGGGKGTILNLPLSPGTSDEYVEKLLREDIPAQLEKWQPEEIIVAAGFDAHLADDMSGLQFSTELYHRIGKEIQNWATRYAGGRVLSILEGGYELSVLGDSVEAYISGLLSQEPILY